MSPNPLGAAAEASAGSVKEVGLDRSVDACVRASVPLIKCSASLRSWVCDTLSSPRYGACAFWHQDCCLLVLQAKWAGGTSLVTCFFLQEDHDGGQNVGQRKRVKLSSSTKGAIGPPTPGSLPPCFHAPPPPLKPISCVFLDKSIMDALKHKCFLEELLFWTIKYEFPQKMVTFLLNMLPDQDYKVCLRGDVCVQKQRTFWS